MNLFSDPKDCCGCATCMHICPKGAIVMTQDSKGFLYPKIDSILCVECGRCKTCCPFQNRELNNDLLAEPDVYAIKHRSDDVRMNSSSGGMFTVISDYILSKGGMVYGAAFDNDFTVCHQRAQTQEERNKFRGSKYVQSDLKQSFIEVKNDLQFGKQVLFSGTPCQIECLSSFLKHNKINIEQLYLCDLVCHGVPSPKIFSDYLNALRSKYRSEIQSMTFRYKPSGWRTQAVNVIFENGKSYQADAMNDFFYRLFSPNIILRDSCYECPYTNLSRPSDITLGDFWGIERFMPEFADEKGVSLALINTKKGRRLFEAVKMDLIFQPSNIQDCLQQNLEKPSVISPKAAHFWKDYQKHGFNFIAKKYGSFGLKKVIKTQMKKLLQWECFKFRVNGISK